MDKPKTIITLLGAGQAKVNNIFIHRGSGSKCHKCKYFNVCVKNLEKDRIYRVVNVRDRILKCEPYNLEMRVVEVVEAEVPAAVSSKQAIEGAMLTFHPQNCGESDCENLILCSPEFLRDGDRCEVVAVYESLKCPRGFQLKRVLLKRVPSSQKPQ